MKCKSVKEVLLMHVVQVTPHLANDLAQVL